MKICPRGLIGTGQDTPLCIGVPGPSVTFEDWGEW
jgi:hypothetical protein